MPISIYSIPQSLIMLWKFQTEVDVAEYLRAFDDDVMFLARHGRQRIEDMKREPRRRIKRYIEALNRLLGRENPEVDE